MTAPLSGDSSATKPAGAEGISVMICAHNAARRIGPTLRHLAAQKSVPVPWEIILVDNGSTDGTSEIAGGEWPADAPAPLRLLSEATLGYNCALERGMLHARFSIIAHVHDDNWLAEDWLARAAAIFASDPEIGACGGRTIASFESPAPEWFHKFEAAYAVGKQSECSGDVTWSRGFLWGAGLCLRRTAWMGLREHGFRSLSEGRKGRGRLISGEDSEICFALRLAGWKLWYSEDLVLTHYLPANRLEWGYLRRLFRSFGEASAIHDCLRYLPSPADPRRTPAWRDALLESLSALTAMRQAWAALVWRDEGNPDVLEAERLLGRIFGLARMRDSYREAHRAVLDAKWRKLGPRPHQGLSSAVPPT